jgi:hypothetical protein
MRLALGDKVGLASRFESTHLRDMLKLYPIGIGGCTWTDAILYFPGRSSYLP